MNECTMNNYKCSTLIIVLVLFSAGCNVDSSKSASEARTNSTATKLRSERSFDKKEIIRLTPESAKAPKPLSTGTFIDEQTAWVTDASTGDLLRTIDGGRNWQRMCLSNEDEAIFGKLRDMLTNYYFVSTSRGWLSAYSGTWQTEDGGLTWRRIFTDEVEAAYFVDEQSGWMNLYNEEGGYQSYLTQNGGRTWQPCGSKRNSSDQIPMSAYFITPQLGWAITNSTIDRQTVFGVAHTNDGGCHWEQLWVSDANPDERYGDIYFLNEQEGWLAGNYLGGLYRTTDAGKTWQEVNLPFKNLQVSDVYFVNAQNGWIITAPLSQTDTAIYHTANAGRTWRQLNEYDVVRGSSPNGEREGIPTRWKSGQLLQMLYISKYGELKK